MRVKEKEEEEEDDENSVYDVVGLNVVGYWVDIFGTKVVCIFIGRFYTALFSAFEHTHCAYVAYDSE